MELCFSLSCHLRREVSFCIFEVPAKIRESVDYLISRLTYRHTHFHRDYPCQCLRFTFKKVKKYRKSRNSFSEWYFFPEFLCLFCLHDDFRDVTRVGNLDEINHYKISRRIGRCKRSHKKKITKKVYPNMYEKSKSFIERRG